jgi:excisionase family DNA binding protein
MPAPARPQQEKPAPRPSFAPRGLRARDAAHYVGVSLNTFLRWVQDGRMPQPRRSGGCVIYDRLELDAAFDDLPQDGPSSGQGLNTWDE